MARASVLGMAVVLALMVVLQASVTVTMAAERVDASSTSPVWSVSPPALQYTSLGLGIAGTVLVIVRPEPLFRTTFSPSIDSAASFNISPTLYSIGDRGAQLMLFVPYLYYVGVRPAGGLAKSYVYTESLLLMHGAATVGKYVVGRQRPEGGNRLSFPSGHSSQSFMVASWLATDLYRTHPDTPLKYVYASVPYGFASFVGATRIGGDKHYFTDVIAGAVLGVAIGYGMYSYHFDKNGNLRTRSSQGGSRVMILPIMDTVNDKYGFTASLRF